MNDVAVWSAPGKVLLIGEYAVLEGGPAYVRAVDTRARVRVVPATAGHFLSAPDIGVPELRFEWSETGGLRWFRDGDVPVPLPPSLSLVAGILACALEAARLPPCRLELDTSAFFAPGKGSPPRKIGLGSSAALTVALEGALRSRTDFSGTNSEDTGRRLGALLEQHRTHQGGRGSGVDIAASLRGGTFVYKTTPSGPEIRPLPLPEGLELLCVWTGRSVSTGDFLERLAYWRRRQQRAYERHVATLTSVAEAAIAAATRRDLAGFQGAVRDYALALENLGAAASLPIVSPVHKRIERLARTHGLTYKPSGAGGGDVGVAFGEDPRAALRFREALDREGFLVVDSTEAREGFRRDPS